MGQILIIPNVIRSLADSIALLQEDDLPINFSDDFLQKMDIGPDWPFVSEYGRDWWNGPKPSSLDLTEILDASSLKYCLDGYKQQLSATVIHEEGSIPDKLHATALTSNDNGPVTDNGIGATSCPKCMKYKDILSDTLNDLVDLHKFSNAMFIASKDQRDIDMRRASIFNLLHEAAIIKETDLEDAPRPMSTMSGKTTPATVMLKARRELSQRKAQPPSAHKWTWGSTLSVEDVLSLSSVATQLTIPEIDTSKRSLPTSYGRYDDVPFPVSHPVPDADYTHIPFFDPSNRLVFDPLNIHPVPTADYTYIPFCDPNIPAPESNLDYPGPSSVAKSLSPYDLGNLADEWVPESDEKRSPSPGHLALAGTWIQGSDEEDPTKMAIQMTTAPTQDIGPVSMSWLPGKDEDDEEESPSSPNSFSIADKWIPESDEVVPFSHENEEELPSNFPSSSRPFSIIDKWIPESDEAAPLLSRAPSPEGIAHTWSCETDDDVRPATPSADIVAGSWECESDNDETDLHVSIGSTAPRSVASDGSLNFHISVTFLTLISRHHYLYL
jgi:hypothetical protein